MAMRLIEIVLSEKDAREVHELLEQCELVEHRHFGSAGDEVLVRILVDADQSEPVLDLLEKRFVGPNGDRVVILPVVATLPRPPEKPEPEAETLVSPDTEKPPERISREELYEEIKHGGQLSRVFLAMVALSTIVAAIGLNQNSVTVIIGAMVIAPLLGPNVAMSLGTTLGDMALLRNAFLTTLVGVAEALALSVILGVTFQVDPTLDEIVARTGVGLGDIAVALASGSAGALAFTAGVSTTLIGVMVAVALLPPLVTSGLLLGGGHPSLALGALSLFLLNLICVNLAGVTTFLAQGIKPTTWWEKDRAQKATRAAIALSAALLALMVGMILLTGKN